MNADNDNDEARILRRGKPIYVLRPGERAAAIGADKVIVVHPERTAFIISAIDGQVLGMVRS